MPIYEYECAKGHKFEKIQPFSASSRTKCPKCGVKADRVISLASFHLKGSGWYAKDSRPSHAPSESSETKVDKKESKAETTAQTKPEKKEAKPEKKSGKKKSA